ncbi:hypothetical protein G9A89_003971 [Geosiphon pyriformis]|nr:hypothetical protein G9A89_003971 [Geosiphon pyriformis]
MLQGKRTKISTERHFSSSIGRSSQVTPTTPTFPLNQEPQHYPEELFPEPAIVNSEITRLHKELVAARKSSKKQSSEIARLESESKILRARVSKLSSEKQEIQQQKEEKSNTFQLENTTLKSKIATAQKELARLRRRNEELVTESCNLKGGKLGENSDIEALRIEIKQTQATNKTLKSELKKLSTDIEQSRTQNEEYKRLANKFEKENFELKETTRKLTGEKNRIEKENKETRQQVEQLNSRNQQLIQKSNNIDAERNKLKSDLNSQQDEFHQLRQTNRKLTSETKTLKRQSGTFNFRIDGLPKDIVKKDSSSDGSKSISENGDASLESDNSRKESELSRQISEVRKEYETLKEANKKLLEANEQLEKEVKECRDKLKKSVGNEQDKGQLENQVKESHEEIAKLLTHNQHLVEEIDPLKEELAKVGSLNSEREGEMILKIQQLESVNQQLQAEIFSLKKEYESMKELNIRLANDNEHLEHTIQESREQIEQLTSRNQNLREETNTLSTEYGERVSISNNREKQLSSKIFELEKLNQQLQGQLSITNQDRDNIKENYSQFQREIKDCRVLIEKLSCQNQNLLQECDSLTNQQINGSKTITNGVHQNDVSKELALQFSLKLEELQQQNDELRNKMVDIKRERDEYKGKLVVTTAKMQAQIKELKKEASQYRFTLANQTDLVNV